MSLPRNNNSSDTLNLLKQQFESLEGSKQKTLLMQLLGLIKMECIPGFKESREDELHLVSEKHISDNPFLLTIQQAIKDEYQWHIITEYAIEKSLEVCSLTMESFLSQQNFFNDDQSSSFVGVAGLGLQKMRDGEKTVRLKEKGFISCLLTSRVSFHALCISLKLINPFELDLRDLPLRYENVYKIIQVAKPACLRLRKINFPSGCSNRELESIFDEFSQSVAQGEVEHLDFSWSMFMNRSGLLFESLKKTKTKKLDLSYNFLDLADIDDWKKLSELIENNKITHLSLAGNFFKNLFENDAIFNVFLEIVRQPSLYFLDISQNNLHQLSEKNFNALVDAIHESTIQRLMLNNKTPLISGCDIDEHKFSIIGNRTHLGKKGIPHGSKSYCVGNNFLQPTQLQKIYFAMEQKYNFVSLKERAAFTIWRQPGAQIAEQAGNIFTFKSDNMLENELNYDSVESVRNFEYML